MWRRVAFSHQRRLFHSSRIRASESSNTPDVINIANATFYRQTHDSTSLNAPLFPNLSFRLPLRSNQLQPGEVWSVLSPSTAARTTFLNVLASHFVSVPATARTYPYLSQISASPHAAIKYVGFDAERGSNVSGASLRGAHLSARYESRREVTDFSLLDYLQGNTELNALERIASHEETRVLDEVIQSLDLARLLHMPVANLSNGQTRRARIAKALMARPEVLLLDGPFMGLDPHARTRLAGVLQGLATRPSPQLILSLRPQDDLPAWVSHLIVIDEHMTVLGQGSKAALGELTAILTEAKSDVASTPSQLKLTKDGFAADEAALPVGEPVVEMNGVRVAYKDDLVVLGGWTQPEAPGNGLYWTLRQGQRCGIFGPNGSGKTTLLSLITSDHPQTYGLPIKLFGRSRLPEPGEPGISVFDLQRRIGHSSPEVHAFFPKNLSARRVLESAWADAPLAKPELNALDDRRIDAVLRWFARELCPDAYINRKTRIEQMQDAFLDTSPREIVTPDPPTRRRASPPSPPTLEMRLARSRKIFDENVYDSSDIEWADTIPLRDLTFASQRLLLFLRAIIASPELVILDEALSGMDDEVRDKALLFLSHGERLSHVDVQSGEKVPSILDKLQTVCLSGLDERQALLCISHTPDDVPGCVREYICLPPPTLPHVPDAEVPEDVVSRKRAPGLPPKIGTWPGPLGLNRSQWDALWL